MAAAAVVLTGLIWCAYGSILENGFAWDDHGYVEFNPALTSFAGLRRAFGTDANQGANPLMPLSYNYRPVTFASLYLNARLLGATARSFHLGNLVLHAALALLLLFFLRRRIGGPDSWTIGAAFVAACWWALHPMQAETVAWASGRYDLLATLFSVAALALQARSGALAVAAQGVLLFLAVMAKESCLPMFAILAVDDWALGRLDRRAIPKYALFAAIVCAWQWIRFRVGSGGLTIGLLKRPLTSIAADYLSAVAIYTRRALAPLPLSVAHTYRPVAPWIALLVLALLAGAAFLTWRRPLWAAPLAMYALLLGTVGLVLHSSGSSAERYFYGPSIGLAWLLALGLSALRGSERPAIRPIVIMAVLAVIALNGASVVRRVAQWRSDATLFSEELDRGIDDWLGQEHLATIDMGLGRLASALSRIQTAREHAGAAGATTSSLAQILGIEAMVHLRLGNPRTALERVRAALELVPAYPSLHLKAAMAYNQLGDLQGERRELEAALRLSPDFAEARIAMCRLKHAHKDVEGARRELSLVPPQAAQIPEVARALNDAKDLLEKDRPPAR